MIGIDFETYSEAGFELNPITGRWGKLPGATQAGISRVGAAVYSEHPSTVVLMIAYDDPHNPGTVRQWRMGDPPPVDLFAYVAAGGLIRAANSMFEFLIWQNVCTARMGWSPVRLEQFRCTLAKSRAYGGPGDLAKAAQAYAVPVQKMTEGKRLIKKFSCPQNFTKTRTQQRAPLDGSPDAEMYREYNVTDVVAEKQVDDAIPPMTPNELELWLTDQRCNARGVAIDVESVAMLSRVVELTTARLNPRVSQLTGGALNSTTELAKLGEWCASRGLVLPNMQKETIDAALDGVYGPPAPDVAEVLGIRQTLGSAAVKKLTAIEQRLCRDNRVRDILAFCGAGQTGRWAGRGPQPQNLPNSGPTAHQCDGCGAYQSPAWPSCHNCGPSTFKPVEWNPDVVDHVLTYSAERFVEAFGDGAIAAASGCLRGLFVAADGHDFICSDYSAIEAVVLAMLAGEQWRIDVFRTHGKIYEMSAAKITGIPFAEFERHKRETGDHHPMRKKVGKVAELASGYQGGIGAWKNFGADKFMTDDEIRDNVKKWRAESPAIVDLWYGCERAAIAAVQSPGVRYGSGDWLAYEYDGKVLRCFLPSGRAIHYHKPFLRDESVPWGGTKPKLYFWGVDPDTKAWCVRDTYGGKLVENATQAVARDIMANALVNLERAGYPPTIHIHDEAVAEVPKGFGSIEEFEQIMATLPAWAEGWPIRAAGGWRGRRYRKD